MSECVGCGGAVVTAMLSEGGDGVPNSVWGLMIMSCESLVVVWCSSVVNKDERLWKHWYECREVESFEGGLCWVVLRTRGRLGDW
jgi:hypothetical protein